MVSSSEEELRKSIHFDTFSFRVLQKKHRPYVLDLEVVTEVLVECRGKTTSSLQRLVDEVQERHPTLPSSFRPRRLVVNTLP